MNQVIGRGFKGIVLTHTRDTVKKFYTSHQQWDRERLHLRFLAGMKKEGFSIDCTIPTLFNAFEGGWHVQNKLYNYCSIMERIDGVTADLVSDDKHLQTLGVQLGTVIHQLHHRSRPHITEWTNKFGNNDRLLMHIFKDKAERVINAHPKEADKYTKRAVEDALGYLQKNAPALRPNALSHLDLKPSNILASKDGRVEGLVDWVGFGLTSPTLSMYQLATKQKLWLHVRNQYTKLGGTVEDDILYAAATIHLAWAPIGYSEAGIDLPPGEGREGLEEMRYCFSKYRK